MIIKRDFTYPTGGLRPLHIYLPDNYYESEDRYPVMYFFDGHNLFFNEDATYGKSWGLKEFLDNWDKDIIIVGMECGHEGMERMSEYLPYKMFRSWFGDMEPKGDLTMQWIINEIKPMIDREYRTWSHREATAIGGSSMGGIMSLYAIVHYNNVFSKGACVSSAIGMCFPSLMNDMKESFIHPDTRAWLSWGSREAKAPDNEIDCHSHVYRNNKAAANKFLAQGAMPQLWCQVNGSHCEADWEKQVPLFMEFLWK